jgi:sec-independent protein translocase protein TatA
LSAGYIAGRPKGEQDMPNIGPLELGIVLIVALIILGPKKLPDMGRSLGRGMREFKGAISGDNDRHEDEAPALTKAEAKDADTETVDAEPVAVERRERTAAAA